MRTATITMASMLALGGCYGGRGAGAPMGEGVDTDTDGSEDEPEPAPLGCDGEAFDPGPVHLRRLTHAEYAQSVRDLLDVDPTPYVTGFPADVTTGSFDNDAANQTISVLLGEGYRDAAQAVAAAVVADPARRDAVLGCDPAQGEDCLRTIAAGLGRRAWRRPLDEDEVQALVALTAEQPSPDEQATLMLEALLQSPKFLFRVELGEPTDDPSLVRLTGYEVGTRLSYFLWGTTPDDALLDAAGAGELDDAEGLAAHARRMLEDDRARATLRNFTEQWFRVRDMGSQYRDPDRFPGWGEPLAASMREELALLVDDYAWGDEGDRGFMGIYTADHGYVDAALAEVYGVAAPAEGLAARSWADDAERGGLLTTAAILTVTGREGVTTPIVRGRFIRESLLCHAMPPPPPDIPMVPSPEPGQSDRERLDQHRQDPSCAGCHDLLEPLGFGLARYDAVGALRTVDDQGQPISAEGSFDGQDASAPDFDGAAQLQAALRDDPDVSACVVRQVHRYAYGRAEAAADDCAMDELHAQFTGSGRSFVELLAALVRSDAFRHIPAAGQED
ncbi:MAG: DUF1592 domain-containing protein [Myxococcales bacterium]|nr:DUF1592 domain-containing protein [Myxococcales bacterium]